MREPTPAERIVDAGDVHGDAWAARLRAATQVAGTVPTDDSASATVVADVPGAVGDNYGPGEAGFTWHEGEASATFVDIGDGGAGPRAQLALYGRRPGQFITLGISIELDPNEALALAQRLTQWAADVALPADEDEPQPVVLRCSQCGRELRRGESARDTYRLDGCDHWYVEAGAL